MLTPLLFQKPRLGTGTILTAGVFSAMRGSCRKKPTPSNSMKIWYNILIRKNLFL